MEEKVEQQTEARDMTERVEEMLSAIDAACTEIERQTEGEPAVTPEVVADVGAQLASDLDADSAEPRETPASEPGVLNAEQSELADADAGFVLDNLIEESEPEEAVSAAAEALSNAVESADDLSNDIAAIAGALAELQAEERDPAAPGEDVTPPAGPEDQTLSEPVAAVVAEPTAQHVGEPVAAEASAPTRAPTRAPQSIEELDSELASLAEAALDGAFEDATGVQSEASPAPARASSTPTEPVEPHAAASVEKVEQPEPAAEPAPQPRGSSLGATASPPPGVQFEADAKPPEPVAAATVLSQPVSGTSVPGRPGRFAAFAAAARVVEPGARKVWLAARPALASAVVMISKPAEKLSASKRDTIGWFAVYTAFLALCVWGFLLLFRKPTVPTPSSDPVGILGEQPAPEDS